MPPRLSKWQAQHKDCQAAVDNLKAHYEKLLQRRVSFICSDCGDDFTETIEALAFAAVEDEIQAPALCVRCGHGAEMEE